MPLLRTGCDVFPASAAVKKVKKCKKEVPS
jgi:hypothetical protein